MLKSWRDSENLAPTSWRKNQGKGRRYDKGDGRNSGISQNQAMESQEKARKERDMWENLPDQIHLMKENT